MFCWVASISHEYDLTLVSILSSTRLNPFDQIKYFIVRVRCLFTAILLYTATKLHYFVEVSGKFVCLGALGRKLRKKIEVLIFIMLSCNFLSSTFRHVILKF